MDEGSPSTSSVGDRQEDPSVALDQLFLELHDQLPKDARGKLVQLVNEVQKRKETNTSAAQTTPPRTPPPPSDPELAKREEDAPRHSSRELRKGEVIDIHCTHDQWRRKLGY